MRPTSAPPSSRASSGPGSGLPIDSPIEAVSLGTAVSLGVIALLELFDQPLEPFGGGFYTLRGLLRAGRGGLGASGGALGSIRGVVRRRAADRRGAQEE